MKEKKQTKIWVAIGIVFVLSVVSLASVHLLPAEESRDDLDLTSDLEDLEAEIDSLSEYVPPYVYTGEPVSFVMDFENDASFYFGADTGLSAEMEVIGDFHEPDVAFLPVGNFYTMDLKAGAYAANLLNPGSYIAPNHYDSFPFLERSPLDLFQEELENYDVDGELRVFEMGESQELLEVDSLWLGHGTWRFVSPEGVEIFIDPQFEYNPETPEEWRDMSLYEDTDVVLLSHGHFDHTTVEDIQLLLEYADPVVIAPFELGIWLEDYLDAPIMPVNKGANLGSQEMIEMGVDEEVAERVGDFRIHLTPADHSSSGTPPGEEPRF